jgi:hypothetical protein
LRDVGGSHIRVPGAHSSYHGGTPGIAKGEFKCDCSASSCATLTPLPPCVAVKSTRRYLILSQSTFCRSNFCRSDPFSVRAVVANSGNSVPTTTSLRFFGATCTAHHDKCSQFSPPCGPAGNYDSTQGDWTSAGGPGPPVGTKGCTNVPSTSTADTADTGGGYTCSCNGGFTSASNCVMQDSMVSRASLLLCTAQAAYRVYLTGQVHPCQTYASSPNPTINLNHPDVNDGTESSTGELASVRSIVRPRSDSQRATPPACHRLAVPNRNASSVPKPIPGV